MPAVDAVLIGAGNRGRFTYGAYARAHPENLRIVALAEPQPARRRVMAQEHGLSRDALFEDWRDLLALPARAPAVIVATADTLHVEPAIAALERGYHVLLEKPIAPTPADCIRVVKAAEQSRGILQISHVLRYTHFYTRVREILESGRLGRLICLDLKEHVAHWHMTHSFVRGKFRNSRVAAPFLLAKCCHDLDLLSWFIGRRAERVSSFGTLGHYRPECAPSDAPQRCTDGCPHQSACPHDAVRFYADPEDAVAKLWPWSDLSPDPSRAARRRALEVGPYGRCVYYCDNDVADHQLVAIEFEGGVTASFGVHGHATHERRTIRVTGSEGELRGVFQDGVIEVTRHGSLEIDRQQVEGSAIGHYGGDEGLLDHFTEVVASGGHGEGRTTGQISLESHLLGFAAEQARLEACVVEMTSFRDLAARPEG